MFVEPPAAESEGQPESFHHDSTQVGHRGHPLEDDVAEARRRRGEEVRPVEGAAGDDAWIVRRQLLAEVEALLAVRATRRQFSADREPTPPRRPAARHGDRRLLALRLPEEGAGLRFELGTQSRVDTVPADAEEPDVAARLIERGRDSRCSSSRPHGSEVDDRDMLHRPLLRCSTTGGQAAVGGQRAGGPAGPWAGEHRRIDRRARPVPTDW